MPIYIKFRFVFSLHDADFAYRLVIPNFMHVKHKIVHVKLSFSFSLFQSLPLPSTHMNGKLFSSLHSTSEALTKFKIQKATWNFNKRFNDARTN